MSYNKGKNNPNYKDGRYLIKYYCKKCNKKIKYNTKIKGTGLCKKCGKIEITKNYLIKEYIIKEKSLRIIAKQVKCNSETIRKRLKDYNIPVRNKSESHKIGLKNHKLDCKCLTCRMLSGNFTGKNNPMFGKKGKEHPCWQNGKSFEEYGSEFDNNLKEQVRFRDKYKCQLCGCTQLENGRQLDCHHKDYDKKNNDINNLISLCKSCHLKTNHNRNYWERTLTSYSI